MQWGDKTQAKKRDITILHATQPGLAIAVAERTSRDNLADTVKAFLTDVGNTPRAGLQWPALLANIETLLLGDAYEEVLRCETKGAQGDVERAGDVATVTQPETGAKKKEKVAESETADTTVNQSYAVLAKQVASISSCMAEIQAGTRKPPPPGGQECYSCGKLRHFARDCRGGPRRAPTRGGRGAPQGRSNTRSYDCYTRGQPGYFARECHQNQRAPCGGGRGHQRGHGGYAQHGEYHGYQEQALVNHYHTPGPPNASSYPQGPATGPQVAAAGQNDNQQGNW